MRDVASQEETASRDRFSGMRDLDVPTNPSSPGKLRERLSKRDASEDGGAEDLPVIAANCPDCEAEPSDAQDQADGDGDGRFHLQVVNGALSALLIHGRDATRGSRATARRQIL